MSELGPAPEAVMVEEMRIKVRPKLSVREAARRAGMSDARWRQISKGYNQASKEVRVPVRAPAETLARMARVVGATSEQLREVGRDDAADELAALASNHGGSATTTIGVTPTADGEVTRDVTVTVSRRRLFDASASLRDAEHQLTQGDTDSAVKSITAARGSLAVALLDADLTPNTKESDHAEQHDSTPPPQPEGAQDQSEKIAAQQLPNDSQMRDISAAAGAFADSMEARNEPGQQEN